MTPFSANSLDSLDSLLRIELEHLYDAEKTLTDALPHLVDAASCVQLRHALQAHLQETRGHIGRLDCAFRHMEHTPGHGCCQVMKELVRQCGEITRAPGTSAVKDAAIIAAAQQIEHYEIAAYSSSCTLAQQLRMHRVTTLLQETLDEELAADNMLTRIGQQHIHLKAAS